MTRPPKHTRLNKPRQPGTLKGAMAALVEANGGVVRTADLLGSISKTQVQRVTDEAEPEAEFKLSHVRLLELACGDPVVTAFLAVSANCALLPLGKGRDETLDIDFIRFAEESAQLFKQYAIAKRDGKLTAQEAGRLMDRVIRVHQALGEMKPELDAAMEG